MRARSGVGATPGNVAYRTRPRSIGARRRLGLSAGGAPGPAACSEMTSVEIRAFRAEDEDSVVAVWRACGLVRPSNNPHQDIQRKLKVRPELFLVAVLDGRVVATAMAGYEGHRGWLNYVAVAPSHQRLGIARLLVEDAERRLLQLGCPKVNLQVRTSNANAVAFWERVGYSVDDVVSMGKRLVADDPSS